MDQLFNLTTWQEILVAAFSGLAENISNFLPNLLGAALILLLGWILSRGLEVLAARALRGLGLDGASTRLRVTDVLERAGIELTFSQIVAKLVFWLVMLTFVLSSVETLGFVAVTETINSLIAFIPSVIGAGLIGIGGLLLGRFVATFVSSGAAAAGVEAAPRLGFLAQIVVVGLVVLVALEQLGVSTDVLLLPFTVALAAAGFAIGLAFALGARPVVTHIMAGHFLKQSLPRNASVEIGGERGLVERVGAVDTLLRSDSRTWSVPNAQLLDHVVVR